MGGWVELGWRSAAEWVNRRINGSPQHNRARTAPRRLLLAPHCQHNKCRCAVFPSAPVNTLPQAPPPPPLQICLLPPSTNWSVLKHDYDIEYITEYKKGLGMRSKVRANVPFLSILLLFIVDLQSMASACCRAVC